MRKLLRLAPMLGWVVLLTGVLMHAAVKDRFASGALFFYGLPKPVLAVLAVVLLVRPGASKKARLCAGAAALIISAWWFALSWTHGPAPVAPAHAESQDVKILFWNLNRPAGIQRDMVDLVNELQPHAAAFVEPGPRFRELGPAYAALLPGYQVDIMPRGILWLSRVPSKYCARGKLDGLGAFARFDVHDLGPPFSLVVADVYAEPFRSRNYQLREVLGQAQGRADAILMGDFNTPAESVHFDAFRAHYRDVLTAAGHGFRETWPLGLPLLSLDHVWIGEAWEIVETRTVHRWSSDHLAILVTLRRR